MLRWWYTSRYTRCRKGREVHKMEDEITRSDLTLNSTPDHVLADFLSDLLLHLVNLLVFLVDLVLHLVHLPVLHLVHPPPPNHHPTSPQQPWPTLLSPLAPKGVKILKERFFWDTLYKSNACSKLSTGENAKWNWFLECLQLFEPKFGQAS